MDYTEEEIQREVDEITLQFNTKLKQIDKNEIITYIRLMEYRSKLYKVEKQQDEQVVEDFKNKFFEKAKAIMHLPIEIKSMDELEQFTVAHTKNTTALLTEYKNAIKQFYKENGLNLYSIRGSKHDTITRSKGIVNQYEAEKGDWVFAASTPKRRNAYRIRSAKHGMIGITDNESVILGDVVHAQDSKLMLDTPAYYYTLKCDKFMPVVRINNTKEDANDFRFFFGEEWTSDRDIKKEDMVSVEEYADVTDLLDNMQIFSTTDEHTIRTLSDARGNAQKRRDIVKDGIRECVVTYWNKELDRGISKYYSENEKEQGAKNANKSELLKSAIEETKERVKTTDINKQVRNIQENFIQKGREKTSLEDQKEKQ